MKRIGVTGGLGFIGSHLVDYLKAQGLEVIIVDNLRRAMVKPNGARFVNGDIRNGGVEALEGCDVVVNLAAESSVMRCEQDGEYAITTNTAAVSRLGQFCLQKGIRLIQASSREVYGEQDKFPVAEDTPYGAKNIYGRSKAEAESALLALRQQGLDVSILRFANVTGTRDEGRLLPLWLTAANRGQPLKVFGGSQMIDFVPVRYAVEAILYSIICGDVGPVNIGSGKSISILELAARIKYYKPATAIQVEPARSAEVTGYCADITIAQKLGLSIPEDPLENMMELLEFYH